MRMHISFFICFPSFTTQKIMWGAVFNMSSHFSNVGIICVSTTCKLVIHMLDFFSKEVLITILEGISEYLSDKFCQEK